MTTLRKTLKLLHKIRKTSDYPIAIREATINADAVLLDLQGTDYLFDDLEVAIQKMGPLATRSHPCGR
jgi:hypothetical protein